MIGQFEQQELGKEFTRFAQLDYGLSKEQLGNFAQQNVNGTIYGPTAMTPNIVEERKLNATVIDIFSRLMVDRTLFLGTAVTDYVANVITAQLLFLQSTDSKRDVTLYINSPGGSVYAGLGIYDTMQFIPMDVATVCTGMAASMASVLLTSGSYMKRSALENSRQMCHQLSYGYSGRFTDQRIQFEESQKLTDKLYNIYVEHTGLSFKEIEKLCQNGDKWMSSEEACAFGFTDEILKPEKTKKRIPKKDKVIVE